MAKKSMEGNNHIQVAIDLEKKFGKMSLKELLEEWLKYKKDEKELEIYFSVLRKVLLERVKGSCPDEKKPGRVNIEEYDILRVVSPKLKWNYKKLEELVGKAEYSKIIKLKPTIDKEGERRIKKLLDEEKISRAELRKTRSVDFQISLKVIPHTKGTLPTEEDQDGEDSTD
jgi:hypothetical protein